MNINHLLFDLDNTLYPSTAAIDQGISSRMVGFVADFLGLDYQQAAQRRKQRLPLYGTTLEWLITEYNLKDVDSFFSAIHPPEEIQELSKDPNLRPFLKSLGLPMTILTNAPLCHATRVLEYLEVADLFTSVHTIQSNNLKGKPYAVAYHKALSATGFTLEETVFFDDHPKYTNGYQVLGGQAVLIQHPETKEGHSLDLGQGDRVHSDLVQRENQEDSLSFIPAPEAGLLPQVVIPSVYQVPQVLEFFAKS